jgi:hypothetical protein
LPPAAAAPGVAAAQRPRAEAGVVAECGSRVRRSPAAAATGGSVECCALGPPASSDTSPDDALRAIVSEQFQPELIPNLIQINRHATAV